MQRTVNLCVHLVFVNPKSHSSSFQQDMYMISLQWFVFISAARQEVDGELFPVQSCLETMTPGSNLTETVQSSRANMSVFVPVLGVWCNGRWSVQHQPTRKSRHIHPWPECGSEAVKGRMKRKHILQEQCWTGARWELVVSVTGCQWGLVACSQTRLTLSKRSGTIGNGAKTYPGAWQPAIRCLWGRQGPSGRWDWLSKWGQTGSEAALEIQKQQN